MPAVTAALVKKLRERTGAGMMDCKKALNEADGDIEKASKALQEAGRVTAETPRSKNTPNGLVSLLTDETYGCIVEINSQTDLAATDQSFTQFADKVVKAAFEGRVSETDKLKHLFEEERAELATRLGEAIEIRQVARLEGKCIAGYAHGTRIAALVSMAGGGGASAELPKQIAMHVAAMKPEFLKPLDVPEEVVRKEYELQCQRETESGNPKDKVERMVNGRMAKFIAEISLTGQHFVVDQARTVSQVLKSEGADVIGFVLVELGGSCLPR
jgi:elongation factor Ts